MNVGKSKFPSIQPTVAAIVEALEGAGGRPRVKALFISGAPGFGKSSTLAAVTEAMAATLGAHIVWVAGAVIASEGDFARVLLPSSSRASHVRTYVDSLDAAFDDLASAQHNRLVLAIDDIDALVFKRDHVAEKLATLLAAAPQIYLVATCHPTSATKLSRADHPFSTTLMANGHSCALAPVGALEDEAAVALVRRRAPGLPDSMISAVVHSAGGHPAALVFLSKLFGGIANSTDADTRVEVEAPRDLRDAGHWFLFAAEFAGAVYAEPWASLGPQQRAILSRFGGDAAPISTSDLADATDLPASQVSSQLTRLVSDGLVRRTAYRGRFSIAPLLAKWISLRVARGAVPHAVAVPHHAHSARESISDRNDTDESFARGAPPGAASGQKEDGSPRQRTHSTPLPRIMS